MFEVSGLEPDAFAGADDEALVAAIEGWNRSSVKADARRLAAIAELTSRCCDKEGERAYWACDGWDSVAGEIAAVLGTSPKRASAQMSLALALRHRLPKVGALFMDGRVSGRVIAAINWHTHFVDDEAALAKVDDALAARAEGFDVLSDYKLAGSIDYWISRHDPDAVRRLRASARQRDFNFGKRDDESDTTAVWGRLYAADAELVDRRLMELMRGVCEEDPRTTAQRRADAMGAMAAKAERLACTCGNPQCPGAGNDGRAANVVIHVVAEAAALEAQPDPHMSGESGRDRPAPAPPAQRDMPAGLLMGAGDKIVPAPVLAELIRSGAKVRDVQTPSGPAESGYRPSVALEEFVRVRDMTCRFPGCEEPAEFCDVDHTIPYPLGPTHPSNLKCVCRKHHLLKTFWTGIGGWADQQLPDGTVVWTAPSGRTYKTLPGSRVFFPHWNTTTAELSIRTPDTPAVSRGVMMPKRRRTRAAARADRIRKERALNAADRARCEEQAAKLAAARNKPPPPADYWSIATAGTYDPDDDPAPF